VSVPSMFVQVTRDQIGDVAVVFRNEDLHADYCRGRTLKTTPT
jgi:hypothetical protein